MKSTKRWMVVFVFVFTAGCRHEAEHVSMPGTSDPDAQFLYSMLDHHMHWDKLIDPCLEKKGIHQELVDLCRTMDTARTAEVKDMTKMLSDWYGKAPPPIDPFPDWVGTLEGSEFEKNFLSAMTQHHSEGIDMSAKCAREVKHAELMALCGKMTDEQRAERKRMQGFSCLWFGACS